MSMTDITNSGRDPLRAARRSALDAARVAVHNAGGYMLREPSADQLFNFGRARNLLCEAAAPGWHRWRASNTHTLTKEISLDDEQAAKDWADVQRMAKLGAVPCFEEGCPACGEEEEWRE